MLAAVLARLADLPPVHSRSCLFLVKWAAASPPRFSLLLLTVEPASNLILQRTQMRAGYAAIFMGFGIWPLRVPPHEEKLLLVSVKRGSGFPSRWLPVCAVKETGAGS